MALNIKDDEVDRLARQLARRTGETITDAVRSALRERLQRLPKRQGDAFERAADGDRSASLGAQAADRQEREGVARRALRRTWAAALMIVDSSAAVVLLLNEPEAVAFSAAIESDAVRLMPASAVLETAMEIERRHGLVGASALDAFLSEAKIVVVPFAQSDLAHARLAFRTFGKGRHRAALNFGDCMVYAACKATGEALLFKGSDFRQTDVLAHPASVG